MRANPPQVAAPRLSALPSETRAALMALARLMAEAEAARIVGEFDDQMGNLRSPFERPAKP